MERSLVPTLDELTDKDSDNKEAYPSERPNKRRKIDDIDDFIVLKKKSKKRKKKSKQEHHSALNNCSICLEPLNSSGYHQVCCLKCGHIFGRKCIEKSIKKSCLCPICKITATTSQIRNLFNTNISVRDIGDRDNWVHKYHQLMHKLNQQMMLTHSLQTKLNKLHYKYDRLEITNKALKSELVKMKSKYQNEQNQRIELMTQNNEIITHNILPWDQFKFNQNTNNISITERIGIPLKTQFFKKIASNKAKVFTFDDNADYVYYSYYNAQDKYDINMSCLRRTNDANHIKQNHLRQINDIRYRKQSEILTISNDKTMVISDIRTKQRKYYIALPDVGNRCLWSNKCEYYVYAACGGGYFCAYDVRINHASLVKKRLNDSMQPIHSLCALKDNRILISSNNECFVLNEDDLINPNNMRFAPFISDDDLNEKKEIYSCIYNEKCDSILVSYKDCHSIIDLKNRNNTVNINYYGSNISANTDILCMNNENKYICFTDNKQRVNIYSCNHNNNDEYRFKKTLHEFNSTICCGVKTFRNKIVGALCNNYLVFYRCIV